MTFFFQNAHTQHFFKNTLITCSHPSFYKIYKISIKTIPVITDKSDPDPKYQLKTKFKNPKVIRKLQNILTGCNLKLPV